MQKFLESIGIGVTLSAKYLRGLGHEVHKEIAYILNEQIMKFIKKLEKNEAKIEIIVDGTYSKRGRDSNDCFVVILVRLPGRYRVV